MPRRLRHAAIVTALALAAAPALAQDALTLDAAVRAAVSRNAGLEASRAAARAAEAAAEGARSGVLPRLSIAEGWQRGDLPVFVFGSLLSSRQFSSANFAVAALNHPPPTNFFQATFSAEQLIFDGGRASATQAAARLEHTIAATAADEAAASLAVETTRAYGRIVAAEAERRAAQAAADGAREDEARAAARRDAGTASDADVLSLSVHAAAMQQRVIQADGDSAIARAELNRLMGAPIGDAFVIVEPAPPPVDEAPLTALLAEAERARPEMTHAAAAEALAGAHEDVARAALLPTAAAQGAYELNGTSFGSRAGGWIVGGEIRWTLSVGGAEQARREAARQDAGRARAAAADVRAAIQVDVVRAFSALRSARAREAVARVAVRQAAERERIVRDRFDAGLAPVEDVLRASTAHLDADRDRVAALVDALAAAASLRRAVGRGPLE